jgi:hypothetical protein
MSYSSPNTGIVDVAITFVAGVAVMPLVTGTEATVSGTETTASGTETAVSGAGTGCPCTTSFHLEILLKTGTAVQIEAIERLMPILISRRKTENDLCSECITVK